MVKEDRNIDGKLGDKINKSLDACIKEGVAAQVMIGIFDFYLIPLALFLNASTSHIGLLISIPNLLSSISQILAMQVVNLAGSRKLLLLKTVIIQILFLLPIPFLIIWTQGNRIVWLIPRLNHQLSWCELQKLG